MSAETLRRDLSRKLQDDLSAAFQRNLAVASVALPFPAIGLMMIEAAVMMCRTVAATIGNSIGEDGTAAEVELAFNAALEAIAEQVGNARADSLAKVMAEIARRKASA